MRIPGPPAMHHVSRRIFLVGMCFWFGAKKEMVCKLEDIACRLSLRLIFVNIFNLTKKWSKTINKSLQFQSFLGLHDSIHDPFGHGFIAR